MAKASRLAPRVEVFSRREGTTLHLVMRFQPRGLLLALGLTLVIVSSAVALIEVRREPFRLDCSRTQDRCSSSFGSRTIEQLPLSRTLRFEVRPSGRHWELVAVTEDGSIRVVSGGRAGLTAHAVALNEYLEDPPRDRHALEYDRVADLRGTMLSLLPVIVGLALVSLLFMVKDRVTVFDRPHGLAIRRLSLVPARRRLDPFRAVAVRAYEDEHRPWYQRSSAYARGGPWRRIVLVEEGGASWWVTPYQNQRYAASDLEAVAAELARYLGLPLVAAENGPRARF